MCCFFVCPDAQALRVRGLVVLMSVDVVGVGEIYRGGDGVGGRRNLARDSE